MIFSKANGILVSIKTRIPAMNAIHKTNRINILNTQCVQFVYINSSKSFICLVFGQSALMWFDFKYVIVLIFYLDEVVSETDNFACEVEEIVRGCRIYINNVIFDEIVYSDAHNFIDMECVF